MEKSRVLSIQELGEYIMIHDNRRFILDSLRTALDIQEAPGPMLERYRTANEIAQGWDLPSPV